MSPRLAGRGAAVMNDMPDMEVILLHRNLVSRGFTFEVNGETLLVRPSTLVTPDIVDLIRAHKAALLDLLRWEAQSIRAAEWAWWADPFGYIPVEESGKPRGI